MFQQEQAMAVSEAAAAADHLLDLEAAEQLIQLSGGEGADDDGGSETRSADSVSKRYCRGADHPKVSMKEKAREVAVASRTRTKSSAERAVDARKEPAAVESSSRRRRVVDVGEERRKRPRFRWLADIYRETGPLATTAPDREPRPAGRGSDLRPLADDMKKRKRAANADKELSAVVVPTAVPN